KAVTAFKIDWDTFNTSFAAYKTSTQSVSATTYTTIVFDQTEYNYGSAYNTSTGEFTAPIDGVYTFSVNQTVGTTPGALAFYVNGNRIRRGNVFNVTGNIPNPIAVDLKLSAGDKVTAAIFVYTGGNLNNVQDQNWF